MTASREIAAPGIETPHTAVAHAARYTCGRFLTIVENLLAGWTTGSSFTGGLFAQGHSSGEDAGGQPQSSAWMEAVPRVGCAEQSKARCSKTGQTNAGQSSGDEERDADVAQQFCVVPLWLGEVSSVVANVVIINPVEQAHADASENSSQQGVSAPASARQIKMRSEPCSMDEADDATEKAVANEPHSRNAVAVRPAKTEATLSSPEDPNRSSATPEDGAPIRKQDLHPQQRSRPVEKNVASERESAPASPTSTSKSQEAPPELAGSTEPGALLSAASSVVPAEWTEHVKKFQVSFVRPPTANHHLMMAAADGDEAGVLTVVNTTASSVSGAQRAPSSRNVGMDAVTARMVMTDPHAAPMRLSNAATSTTVPGVDDQAIKERVDDDVQTPQPGNARNEASSVLAMTRQTEHFRDIAPYSSPRFDSVSNSDTKPNQSEARKAADREAGIADRARKPVGNSRNADSSVERQGASSTSHRIVVGNSSQVIGVVERANDGGTGLCGTGGEVPKHELEPPERRIAPEQRFSTSDLNEPSAVASSLRKLTDRSGRTEVHITLRTPEMGHLELRASSTDSHVSAAVAVESRELKHALVSDVAGLASVCTKHDIDPSHISITDFAAEGAGASSGGSQQHQQQRETPSPRVSVLERPPSADEEELLEKGRTTGLNITA